jgi:hypothetical protein
VPERSKSPTFRFDTSYKGPPVVGLGMLVQRAMIPPNKRLEEGERAREGERKEGKGSARKRGGEGRGEREMKLPDFQ